MFSCQHCGKDLKVNQTLVCSKDCRKLYRKRMRAANRRDDKMLNSGVTGRGVFSLSGNHQ